MVKMNKFGNVINNIERNYDKPLVELNWVLEKYFEKPGIKSAEKVENWFKCHKSIPKHEVPNSIMHKLNTFDNIRYEKTKVRFQ